MLKIGIFCENTQKCDVLKNIITNHMKAKKIKCTIDICNSFANAVGDEFNLLLKSDICIIDFSNHTNAVKLTALLTERRNDFTWLCMGASLQTFMGLLLLRPSGYIREPNNDESARHLLNRVIQFIIHKEKEQYFMFKFENKYMKIPYADISYFESRAKKVALHLYNSPQIFYITAKLDDIQTAVPYYFMRCHQSFLVSMKHIRCFDQKDKKIIVFPNEDVLISRRKYTESRKIYEEFRTENI